MHCVTMHVIHVYSKWTKTSCKQGLIGGLNRVVRRDWETKRADNLLVMRERIRKGEDLLGLYSLTATVHAEPIREQSESRS